MYIFAYVPVTGRIARAIARNRVGPLLTESPSGEELVRAREGHLKRRVATLPCGTIAIQAVAPGQNRSFPVKDCSQPPPLAIGAAPWM